MDYSPRREQYKPLRGLSCEASSQGEGASVLVPQAPGSAPFCFSKGAADYLFWFFLLGIHRARHNDPFPVPIKPRGPY